MEAYLPGDKSHHSQEVCAVLSAKRNGFVMRIRDLRLARKDFRINSWFNITSHKMHQGGKEILPR